MDMLKEKIPEEKDLDMNEQENIIMKSSREENWRDVAQYGQDNSNIRALMWDV